MDRGGEGVAARGMSDQVQGTEGQWETIEAAFHRCTRAFRERREGEQRLREERDSSEREAASTAEESIGEITDAIRRIKEMEAEADEVVGKLAPLRGREWHVDAVTPQEGIPQERLAAVLQDCEAAAAKVSQAAEEYPRVKKEEDNRRSWKVLLIVLLGGILFSLLVIIACCSSAIRGTGEGHDSGSSPARSTVTSSVEHASGEASSSVAIVSASASRTPAGTSRARITPTVTRSASDAATATSVLPRPTPSHTGAPASATASGYDTSACRQAVGLTFRTLWARYRRDLGCALESQHGLITSYQRFEHGHMVYRADQPDQGYVLFGDGTWQVHSADWHEGMAEYSCADQSTPSTTPPTPRRGFGFLWCHNAVVRERLGWATMDESGNWRNFQSFEGGWAIELEQVADSPMILVLDGGNWHWV
jgi:hypothetical protein